MFVSVVHGGDGWPILLALRLIAGGYEVSRAVRTMLTVVKVRCYAPLGFERREALPIIAAPMPEAEQRSRTGAARRDSGPDP